MTCPCDIWVFPPPLAIPAGLDDLPRQIAGFPEFRAAMLAAIPTEPALAQWRARGADDFGVMLLEMWAYVCDVTAFYDKLIADESYLRTAKRRPSVRKLTGLLGYVPRPAVAASVRLGLLVDGLRPLSVPVGTAFRSGAFGAEPPQVFEVDAAATAYPALNSFPVATPRETTLSGSVSSLLLDPATATVKDGDHVLVDFDGAVFLLTVALAQRATDTDGKTYVRVDFDVAVSVASAAAISATKIFKPTRSASLRGEVLTSETDPFLDYALDGTDVALARMAPGFEEGTRVAGNLTSITLDGVYTDIKAGDRVIVSEADDFRWSTVSVRVESAYTVVTSSAFTVNGDTVTTPAVTARFTTIQVEPSLNRMGATEWTNTDAPNLVVHWGLVEAGRVMGAAHTVLAPTDPIQLVGVSAGPAGPLPLERAFLRDAEDVGIELSASLDWTTAVLTPDPGTTWTPDLAVPVTAYGNVVDASRGETVGSEILGSGDASQPNQAFTLKKRPLTYVASPTADNESGVASTLQVHVDGVEWTEVASFYGQASDASVFIVRQDDDGASIVTFGDGVNGRRLPSGADNVVASYRFGAGAAAPPAGSIRQLAKPVAGLRGVVNPVVAAGGADAETVESIRTLAPRSALLLGRAVSILDMEAAAAATPGVIAAAAEWRWEGTRQRPVVKVWYIGGAGLEPIVSERLRAISDPSTPIDVEAAQAVWASLTIDIAVDARYVVDDVVIAVDAALLDPSAGILVAANIGIGAPIFRSRIFEAVLGVAGTVGVQALLWDGQPFASYGKQPGAGKYFDVESGGLEVTGTTSVVFAT